jgi:hypothetical protein
MKSEHNSEMPERGGPSGWIEVGIDLEEGLTALSAQDAAGAAPGLEDRLAARAVAAMASGDATGPVAGRITPSPHGHAGVDRRGGMGAGGVGRRRWRVGVFGGAVAAVLALGVGLVFVVQSGRGGALGGGAGAGGLAASPRIEVDVETMLAGLAALDADSGTGAELLMDAETLERSLRTGTTLEDLGGDSL